jgi:YebC/PmpR family DNA-binding regulatory protein
MSGHSHAKNIAHQKAATDQKKGQVFSKMVRLITIAVKEAGSNPETNSKLEVAIQRAKYFKMPNDNIERAIKQASGGTEGKELNEFAFEAYGPSGTALIIEGITDNKNRTLGEIKQLLSQYGGKMAQEGSVRWLFEKKGVLVVNLSEQTEVWQNKENLEMKAIEAGADDADWQNDILEVTTSPESLQSAKAFLEKEGIKVSSSSADWLAKDPILLEESDRNLALKLLEAVDENDDVQDVYSNLKN